VFYREWDREYTGEMMLIDRTKNSDINALAYDAMQGKPARAAAGRTGAYAVDTDTAGYVARALSLSSVPTSSSAVDEARALLAAGLLDSADAARQAAANLVTRGI
jgi:hypothetical protein